MTIGTSNRNDAVGSGSTATYPYGFKVFAATDLRVTVRHPTTDVEATLTYPTHYTVTGVGAAAGGNVVLVNGAFDWIDGSGFLDDDWPITIRRVRTISQTTDVRNQGDFYPEVHEDTFDHLVMIDQQQQDEIDRSMKLPETVSSASVDPTMPVPEAFQIVGWNEDADALVNYAPEDIVTVAASGNWNVDTFVGGTDYTAGTTTQLTLSAIPGSENNTQIFFDGVYQEKGTYGVSGAIVTFDAAIPVGVAKVEVVWSSVLSIGIPADGSVGADQFNSAVVTPFALTVLDDTTAANALATLGALAAADLTIPQCGRLTLTTALPVTTADVTGATTVYFTPYKGNVITLYDGTDWVTTVFAELSQITTDNTKSPAAVANSSNYDIFVWNDAGTLRATRGPAWSSDTARGTGAGTTELEVLEGRYVNKIAITNGPAAQRGLYVGTVRSDGSAQINDSLLKRHVWNNFNRVERPMKATESTDTWTYTTATFRQANANAANQLDMVRGLNEDPVWATVNYAASNSGGPVVVTGGIGVSSTSANSASTHARQLANTAMTAQHINYIGSPGIGRQFLAWLEWSTASGTTTWGGDNGSPTDSQSGIIGGCRA